MHKVSTDQSIICPILKSEKDIMLCTQNDCFGFDKKDRKCLYIKAAQKFAPKILEDSPGSLLSLGYNFNALYQKHYRRVYALNYRMLRNKEDAEDITQETFIRAYKNFLNIDPCVPVFSWLFRVATNLCMDKLSKSKGYKFHYLDAYLTSEDFMKKAAVFAQEMDMAHDVEIKESLALANKAMEKMMPHYVQVLMLRICDGISSKEVAKIMNTSISAIDTLLFRAKKKFKEIYQELSK